MISKRTSLLLPIFALFLVLPSDVLAQSESDVPLSRILIDFLGASVRMNSGGSAAGNPHEAHFLPGFAQLAAPFELNKSLVAQLSTFPIGSSSSGFVYNRDPVTGAQTLASQRFGPSFAERPLTGSKRNFNAGLNFQRTKYDSFEGLNLDDNSIKFYLRHNNCCPGTGTASPGDVTNLTPFFEGDLIESTLSLNLETSTTSFFANYGVMNNFDVGIVVPFVSVDLDASGVATIDRISTSTAAAPNDTLIHSWDGQGQRVRPTSVGGSSSGIGDILLRGKYNSFKPTGRAWRGLSI